MKKLFLLLFLLLPKLCFALTYSGLPTSGQLNLQSYTITDSNGCVPGTTITSGGGSTTCQLFWNGANWVAMATVPGGSLSQSATPSSCTGTFTLTNGDSGVINNGCVQGTRTIAITAPQDQWQPYLLTQSAGSLEIVSPSGSDTATGVWSQQ